MANIGLAARLLFARQKANLTQPQAVASAKLEVGVSSLSDWENGNRDPSVLQLSKLAELYNRPFDWFLADSEPLEHPIRWRQRPESPQQIESKFRLLATYYHELELLCDSKAPLKLPEPVSVRTRRAAELLADRVRNDLQLGPRPARTLRSRLEEAYGIKLFCLDFEPAGTAATLCERDGVGVAVLLNQKNSPRRLVFDLAHELYHVVSTVADVEQDEKFADAFAAQLLMPTDEFLREIDGRSVIDDKISHGAFLEVVREFGVSIDAAVWQLHKLRHRPRDRVPELIKQLRLEWQDEPNQKLYPSRLPERYVTLAKQALRNGDISTGYYAKCLDIPRHKAMAEQNELLESLGEELI
ncbi:MAG TPA: XRE family transcriptional regulator [Polyangiaceae bacterium]